MTKYLNATKTSLTAAGFKALRRNADGDIIDLSVVYPYLTQKQREALSDDDYSRVIELDEDMLCLVGELLSV